MPEFIPRALGFNSSKRTGARALGPVQAEKDMNQDPQRAARRERPNWRNICLWERKATGILSTSMESPPPPVASPGPGFELMSPGGPGIPKERKVYVLLLAFANTKPLWRHIVSHVTYEIIADSPLKMTSRCKIANTQARNTHLAQESASVQRQDPALRPSDSRIARKKL